MTGMRNETSLDRLRKAVDNQAALGEPEFHLPIMEAAKLVQAVAAESRAAALPRDADGNEIPLNTGSLYSADGKSVEVSGFSYGPVDGWLVCVPCVGEFSPEEFYLNRRDSWDSLLADLDDMSNGVCRGDKDCSTCLIGCGTEESIMRNVAKRIRDLRRNGR